MRNNLFIRILCFVLVLSFTSCSFFGKKKRDGWKPKSYAYDKDSHYVDEESEESDDNSKSDSGKVNKSSSIKGIKKSDSKIKNKREELDKEIVSQSLQSKGNTGKIGKETSQSLGTEKQVKETIVQTEESSDINTAIKSATKNKGDGVVIDNESSHTSSKGRSSYSGRRYRSIPEMSYYQMLIGSTNRHVYLRDLRTKELYSMDRNTGKIEWVDESSVNVLLVKHSKWRLFHNPIIVEDELIIGSKLDNLHIVSLETNKEINRPRINCSSPLVYSDGMLYTSDGNRTFRGIDLKYRKVVWESLYEWGMDFEPVISEDKIFFADMGGMFYAIDKKTGEKKWTSKLKRGNYKSAYIFGRNLYVPDSKQYVHVFDMETGREINKYYMRLFLGCIGIENGRIFLGAGCKYLYAIDLQTNKVIWKFKADVNTKKKLFIKDGIIYTGSRDGNIYGIDLATGEKKWEVFTAGVLYTTPVIEDGVMYIGDSSDKLYAIDMEMQKIKWEYSVPGDIKNDVVVRGDYVYLVTNNGVIYTIDITEGDLYCRHILNILNKRTSFNY